MRQSVFERAYGKVNLALNVGGVRDDGFHEVHMILQQVGVWDEITLYAKDNDEVTLESNLSFLVKDDRNIAVKAVKLMQQCYGVPGAHIRLFKKIPVAAGMAGGSTDAAAVLRAVDRLYDLNLPTARLKDLGARLGSDVPFCIEGGCALAEGRGEILTKITPLPGAYCVLVKPNFGISTPWSYQHYKEEASNPPADLDAMQRAMAQKDLKTTMSLMRNQLRKAAVEEYPVIAALEEDLTRLGALGAIMTGSGPTVFGVFETAAAAQKAYFEMKHKYFRFEVMECRIGYDPRFKRGSAIHRM